MPGRTPPGIPGPVIADGNAVGVLPVGRTAAARAAMTLEGGAEGSGGLLVEIGVGADADGAGDGAVTLAAAGDGAVIAAGDAPVGFTGEPTPIDAACFALFCCD